MTLRLFRIVAPLTLSVLAYGASPVGTITGAGGFELRGTPVKTAGIPSWPISAGDEIRTTKSPATIEFRDGSVVTLSELSLARVIKTSKGVEFRLMSGGMRVVAGKDATVSFSNNGQPVSTHAGAPVTVSGNPAKPGRFAPESRTPNPPPPPPVSGQ